MSMGCRPAQAPTAIPQAAVAGKGEGAARMLWCTGPATTRP